MPILTALSARDRRALAVGLCVLTALVAGTRGVPAWRAWDAGQRSAAAEVAGERSRALATVRAERWIRDSARARGARLSAVSARVVAGRTPAAAAAALGSIVSEAGASAGVRLGAVQVSTDTIGAGDYLRVRAQVEGTGDVQGVSALLRRLEAGPEALAVRELSVTQPEPAAGADRAEALRLAFTVEGLALRTAGARPRATGARP